MRDNDSIILENIYNNVSNLEQYKELYNRGEYDKCQRLAENSGETQRGIPESTMLRTQRKLQENKTPNFFTNLIEHIGDLSHRAQQPHGRALENVHEKIRLVEQTMGANRWDLEKELSQGCIDEATTKIVNTKKELIELENMVGKENGPKYVYEVYEIARKKYPDEIKELAEEIEKNTYTILEDYVEAHKKHNIPVTVLGELGKEAAIYLGMLDFSNLRDIIKKMRDWLNRYQDMSKDDRVKFFLMPKE